MDITKCFCGRLPFLKYRQTCYAHGEYPVVAYVECECGMRGADVLVDGAYGSTTTEDDAIRLWNDKVREFRLIGGARCV